MHLEWKNNGTHTAGVFAAKEHCASSLSVQCVASPSVLAEMRGREKETPQGGRRDGGAGKPLSQIPGRWDITPQAGRFRQKSKCTLNPGLHFCAPPFPSGPGGDMRGAHLEGVQGPEGEQQQPAGLHHLGIAADPQQAVASPWQPTLGARWGWGGAGGGWF